MVTAEAIEVMDRVDRRGRPIPFSITFCTHDKKRRKGGQIRTIEKAVRCGAAHSLQRHRQIAVQPADGSGHNIPIHLRLILRINGEFVHL